MNYTFMIRISRCEVNRLQLIDKPFRDVMSFGEGQGACATSGAYNQLHSWQISIICRAIAPSVSCEKIGGASRFSTVRNRRTSLRGLARKDSNARAMERRVCRISCVCRVASLEEAESKDVRACICDSSSESARAASS